VLGQQTTKQRPADGAEPGGHAERSQRLDPFACREDDLDHGENLRDHDGAEYALGDPAADQHARTLRGSARGRHQREPGHADQEQPLATERVAQPAAGDQHERVGEGVAGQRPLHVRIAGVQVPLDRRDRDIDYGYVKQVHEGGQQQHD
jgi:hypothetical protein